MVNYNENGHNIAETTNEYRMFKAKVFLGFEVTPAVRASLDEMDSHLLKSFIKHDDVYLTEIIHEDCLYLGKFAADPTNVTSLELLEENIKSLAEKILPDFRLTTHPIHLFPLVEP